MHKIYIGSPCSGRVPRAIQPAWAHPARAIIQTTLLAIFPFEKKLRHTNPARSEAWARSGRHFVFCFQFHLFLISGAIPKVKKIKIQKKVQFASLGLAGVHEGMIRRREYKRKNILKKSLKLHKYTLKHTFIDDSETDRCLFLTCLIFATRLLSEKYTLTFTLLHMTLTHTHWIRGNLYDHGGKLWKLKKKKHMKIMIYFVKRNVCPSISWNSVQESSYTQVLINII